MRYLLPLAAALAISLPALAGTGEYTVHAQNVKDRKAVIATIQSVREVQARARINGTISALSVKEGDRVAKDDVLAVVGDQKLTIRGKGSEARIQAAHSAYEKAKTDLDRAQKLKAVDAVSQARLDDMQSAFRIAEQTLVAAKSEKQEILQQSTEGAVLAPGSGRVLKVPVTVGGVIMAGETVATLSQENYILRLEVPESHAQFLKAGDKVEVGARGLQADNAPAGEGTVKLVYPEIRDGRVVADVEAAGLGDYFVGERTHVYLTAGDRQAFIVPPEYLRRAAGIDMVRLKDGRDIAVQRGEKTPGGIELLAGVSDGDVLVRP